MFFKNRGAVIGLALLVLIITASLAGPFLLRADPFDVAGAPMTPPLEDGHWLGTDYVGRDIFTGIVYGGRATLAVALAATAFNLVIGLSVGALAGYYQGATNTLLMKMHGIFPGTAAPAVRHGDRIAVQPVGGDDRRGHRPCDMAAARAAHPLGIYAHPGA